MSEYQTTNMILGIIGTITGTIALIISYLIYRKEKPNLKLEISKCKHSYTTSTSQVITINFWASFHVHNLGDRGTRINDVGLSFVTDEKDYQFKKRESMDPRENDVRIEAHDTVNFSADFWGIFESEEKEKIDCVFTIYHTHGTMDVQFTSEKKTS